MANKDGIYSNAIKNHLNNFAKERLLKFKKSKFNIELTDLFKSILVTGSVLGKEFDENYWMRLWVLLVFIFQTVKHSENLRGKYSSMLWIC